MSANKQYLCKVSTISGTTTSYLTTWKDIIGFPRYEIQLNGGIGEITVNLARKWSDFGETYDIKNGNLLQVYVYDRDTQADATLVATGVINGYTPVLTDNDEHIQITALGLPYSLNNAILTASGTGVTSVNYYSTDPSTMLAYFVNQYNTTVSGKITLTTNIDTTGSSVSYVFNLLTYKQAFDKILELSPNGWYYTIDTANVVQFHPRQWTAKHTLVIGRHISAISPFKNIEDVKNIVYFVGGNGLQSVYRNSSSILQYGERSIVKQDQRITVQASMDIVANAYLNEHANPEVRTTLTVIDNNGDDTNRGYDIESLQVGQAMAIIHPSIRFEATNWDEFTWDDGYWDSPIASALSQPMQIVRITYEGDRATLELSTKNPDIAKRLEDINRNLRQFITDTTT